MVKIAIAGGSGEVAKEILDALIATKKHDIVLLSRKNICIQETTGLTWAKVNYDSKEQLVKVLHGVHTVLSFITTQTDPGNIAQKNLIDASVLAGVKRFAPSEWATSRFDHMEWFAGKIEIREYLKTLNKNDKVLEYTLFQPGLFTNYFTHPHRSAKYVSTFQTMFDFENRRAIISEGGDDALITLTTAQDLTHVVTLAIEYEGEWPVTGGIKGSELSVAQLIRLGEDVRGGSFAVERLRPDDLKAGTIKSSWLPHVTHAATPSDQAKSLSGMALGISAGALHVSDEWNKLLPHHEFTQPYDFLINIWKGKP